MGLSSVPKAVIVCKKLGTRASMDVLGVPALNFGSSGCRVPGLGLGFRFLGFRV